MLQSLKSCLSFREKERDFLRTIRKILRRARETVGSTLAA